MIVQVTILNTIQVDNDKGDFLSRVYSMPLHEGSWALEKELTN